ncbi:MAG: TIGR00269 family protein [archaeon]
MQKQGKKNPKTCEQCTKKTSVTLPYGPHYFCEKHFTKFFENRFKKTIRKYNLFKPKEKLLIALSGGKDSCVLLYLITKYYSKSNSIQALIIDEGVKGYREKAINVAKELCSKLNVNYLVVEFKKEFGLTNDKLMPLVLSNPTLGGTCAFCGTMRRNLMNKYAKKLRADKLLTGHNLDDEVQSFVMNVFNNDFKRLKRMNATSGIIDYEGFVKRIKPLYETPEKEIITYAAINEIKHYSQECCPYSWTAKRNEYREMLNTFENRFPGTEYSILRFFENLKPYLKSNKNSENKIIHSLHECKNCKEPTEKDYCKTCEMIQRIKKEEMKTKNKKEEKDLTHLNKYNKKLTCQTTKN